MATSTTRLGVSGAMWDKNDTFVDFLRFQELTLSPRVIHFAPHEVVWQCRFKCERESEPNMHWEIVREHVPILRTSKLEAKVSREQWHAIVHSYSARALTFTKDRLPAIAALATRTQDSRSQDRYLAGLWRSSLCEDLMWYTPGLPQPGPVNDVIARRIAFLTDSASRIPSWSWASTQRSVHWGTEGSTVLSCVRILDVTYSIDGPDVSGEILNAEITLRAPIVSLDRIQNELEISAGIKLSSHDFRQGKIKASHERQVGVADGLVYGMFSFDDHGWAYGRSVHPDLFALFLIANSGDTFQHALIIKEMEPGKKWIRLGIVEISPRQYALEKFLRKKKQENLDPKRIFRPRGKAGPHEREKEHRNHFRMMLEAAETRVITLV
jgi:hypothetical protein